jgi:hypothetical protein
MYEKRRRGLPKKSVELRGLASPFKEITRKSDRSGIELTLD